MGKDTLNIASTEPCFFEALLTEDTQQEQFVKLAENHRRDRVRRVDAGDETAQIKFPRPAAPPRGPPPSAAKGGSRGSERSDNRGSEWSNNWQRSEAQGGQ